jgi:hypothetical protein
MDVGRRHHADAAVAVLVVNEAERLRQLEEESRRLKQMVADLSLDNRAPKEVVRCIPPHALAATVGGVTPFRSELEVLATSGISVVPVAWSSGVAACVRPPLSRTDVPSKSNEQAGQTYDASYPALQLQGVQLRPAKALGFSSVAQFIFLLISK